MKRLVACLFLASLFAPAPARADTPALMADCKIYLIMAKPGASEVYNQEHYRAMAWSCDGYMSAVKDFAAMTLDGWQSFPRHLSP